MTSISNRQQLIQELRKQCNTESCKEIIEKLESLNFINVTINETNETGTRGFAVVLKDSNDFWLNFFKTREEAEKFCNKMNFVVQRLLKSKISNENK